MIRSARRRCFVSAAIAIALVTGVASLAPAASAATGSTITAPALIGTGVAAVSPNGNFRLVMQSDGNLVLYSIQNNALWSTHTSPRPGNYFAVQSDGNLVIYAPGHGAVWSSGTYGSGGSRLVMQDDGNLVLYRANGQAVWASHTVVPRGTNDNPVSAATLRGPAIMTPGAALVSPGGAYQAIMQTDGNFVVYSGSIAIWASHTSGNSGAYLDLQSDNNLVLYSATGRPLWLAGGTWRTGANQLLLGDDGVLRLYDPPGNVRWASVLDSFVVPASGSFTVHSNGNGHGHGMSQYGAQGAALAGLSATRIVAFYYPGTALTAMGPQTMRVQVGNAGSNTCLLAKAGLTASGTGLSSTPLPSSGRIRLVPNGSGIAVQSGPATSCTTGTWLTVATAGPQVDVSSTAGFVRTYWTDGSSVDYRGSVGAVRSGAGELTINRVSLEDYTAGVVPREMPASWAAAAVEAQAIAARTYGEYEREHPISSLYDICDSTMCQVYGGMTRYAADGTTVLWSEYQPAVTATAGQVLTYGGGAIFAQFSASNGGWTVAGGQPYLVAKADPYDNPSSGDPYLNLASSSSGARVAQSLGWQSVSLIQITARDGNGVWGGRVVTSTVVGVDASGSPASTTLTGYGLQSALGVPSNWLVFG